MWCYVSFSKLYYLELLKKKLFKIVKENYKFSFKCIIYMVSKCNGWKLE